MSETDSFIDEVSEEVRRDRLYGYLRRYGWIAVALVVLLVGGAAYNEWRKASEQAAAEALGDAILAAEGQEGAAARAAALDAIGADADTGAVVKLLAAADGDGAETSLRAILSDPNVDALYRDLAALKLATLDEASVGTAEARDLLQPLTQPGAAFRVLAEEQLALIDVAEGNTEAAIERLRALLVDDEASGALRRRASQLIVALGGSTEAS